MSKTVVCPSGLSLSIRGMKGKELKIIGDRAAFKTGTFLDKILNACVEEVFDQGPYSLKEDGSLNWDTVLVGDRIFVAIQIRIETFGNVFSFKTLCGACDKKSEHDADLSQVEVKLLSKEDSETLRSGEPLACLLPGTDQKVGFRLATGMDEKRILNPSSIDRAGKEDPVIAMLSRRIVSIEGVDNVKAFLNDLSLGSITSLLKAMNKRDCGVDTSMELACSECGTNHEVSVPIGSAPFWLPV